MVQVSKILIFISCVLFASSFSFETSLTRRGKSKKIHNVEPLPEGLSYRFWKDGPIENTDRIRLHHGGELVAPVIRELTRGRIESERCHFGYSIHGSRDMYHGIVVVKVHEVFEQWLFACYPDKECQRDSQGQVFCGPIKENQDEEQVGSSRVQYNRPGSSSQGYMSTPRYVQIK